MKQRNLVPAITGSHKGVAPETFAGGKHAIDEIFVSSTLDIAGCGYLEHGINNGDHRPIWIDVTKDSALGTNPPPVSGYNTRRLKTKDPRIVKKYNEVLEKEFLAKNVYKRSLDLYNSYQISKTLRPEQYAEYDELDRIRDKSMKKAEKKF